MKKNPTRHLMPLTLGALLLSFASAAPAAEYVWTTLTNGLWNTASNWIGGAPASAADTILRFTNSGTTTYTASNNVANPFQLNQLIFDSTSSGLTRVAGSQLQFTSSGGAQPLIIQNGTGAVVISNAIATAADLTFSGTGTGALTANGIISGNNSLIKNSSGLLTLTGANTFGGTNRWVMINGGTLSVNNTARLGSTTNRVMISSNALLQFTASLTHIRAISLGTDGGRIEVTGNNLVTQSGAFTNNANPFTKEGTGTLVITSSSGRTGATTNNGGLLQLNSVTALGNNLTSRVVRINGGTVAHNNATASAATYELNGGTLGVTTNGNLDLERVFSGVINVIGNSGLSVADARIASNGIKTILTAQLTGTGGLNITGPTLTNRAALFLTNLLNSYSGVLTVNSNVDVFATHTNGVTLSNATIVLNSGSTFSLRAGTTNLVSTNRNTNYYFNNNVIVRGDSILDTRRPVANMTPVVSNVTTLLGLSVSNATLTLMTGNNYSFEFTGGGTLDGQARLLVSNGLTLVNGVLTDGPTPGTLLKAGGGNLLLTNPVNRSFTGGTVVEEGILTFAATDGATLPLGNGDITLGNGTLRPRVNSAATNLVIGPGAGYNVNVTGLGTIQVGGLPNGQATLTHDFGGLTLGSNRFTVSQSNNHILRFSGLVTLTDTATISNTATLTLNGPFTDGGAGFGLNKTGNGTLNLSNLISRDFSGPVTLEQGTLRVSLAPGLTNALGSHPNIYLNNAGTLDLRTLGVNATLERAAGDAYNLSATNEGSLSRVRLQRDGAAGTGLTVTVGDLTLTNGVRFAVSNANNYGLRIGGTTTIGRNVVFDNAAAPVAGTFAFELGGPIAESAPGTRFTKGGFTQPMSYTGLASPGFTGGTLNDAGLLAWRPNALPGGTYRFGTGAVQLDNGAAFAFQNNQTASYTLENDFIIGGARAGNGRTNYGAVLDFTRVAGSPQVTVTGDVRLRAPLNLNAGTAGSTTPATLAGGVVVESADAALVVNGSGTGNGRRVIVSGAVSDDSLPRNLALVANNAAVLSFQGDNSGFAGDFVYEQAYTGNQGRVRFDSFNALPGGKVRAAAETVSVLGFNLGAAGVANVFDHLQFASNAILALELSNGADLDLAALGQDARLGAPEGFTITNSGTITPFNNRYKLGGGGGTLVITNNDGLRNNGVTPRSLDALPNPYAALSGGAAPGTVSLTGSNSYTGGTVAGSGLLSISSGRASTPLGTGPVEVYGVLRATGAGGSFADAAGTGNNNLIRTYPGSEVRLDNSSLNTNRWGDTAAVGLDGALFQLIGVNAAQRSFERVGAISFDAGSRITLTGSTNTVGASAVLSAAGLNRVGRGTLQLGRAAGGGEVRHNLGESNQFLVDGGLPLVNGMVAPYLVNGTDHQFLTYGATGFANAAATSGDLNTAGAADIVNQAAATTLASDRSVHALRLGGNLSSGAGTVIELGSGGLIFTGTATNTGVSFRFGAGGTGEGLLYVAGGATAVFNGTTVTAGAGITKFGDGTLSLVSAHPAYASGWNLNRGTLTVATGSGGGALGAPTAGNFLNLNGGVTLNLNATNNLLSHNSGLLTARETNSINANFGDPDRTQTFAPLGLRLATSGSGPLESYLRLSFSESRSVLNAAGVTTLADDAAVAVVNTTVVSGSSNRLVLAGGLAGTNVTLFKRGNGTLAVFGNNSAQLLGARTHVEQGVLAVNHNGALGNGASAATIAPGAVLQIDGGATGYASTAPITFAPGSAERWAHPLARFSDLATPQTITLPQGVNLQVMATMTNFSDKVIRLQGGSLEAYLHADDSRANNISISGVNLELYADSSIGQSGVDRGRGNLTLNFYGDINDDGNSRSFSKIGADTVVLRSANINYGGATKIEGGILRLTRSEMLPDSSPLYVGPNGTLDLNNNDETVGRLSGGGRIINSTTNENAFYMDISEDSTFNGTFEGHLAVNRNGPGTLYLGGASTSFGTFYNYDGAVVVTASANPNTGGSPLGNATNGLVFLTGNGKILTGGAVEVARAIRVDSVVGGTKVIGGATPDVSSFSDDITLFGDVTLTATNGGRVNFDGSIFDVSTPRGVSKTGAGTVNLATANFWRAGTDVAAGTLLVNNPTGSATGSGNVSVQSGAVLGGSGTIAGSVILNGTAALTPGNSAGRLRIDSNLSFAALSSVTFEIGGLLQGVDYDHLSVGTNATLAGTIQLTLAPGYFPAAANSFELATFASRTGVFGNAANGARLTTTDSLGSFQINYGATNVIASAFQYNDSDLDGIYDAWALKHFGLASLAAGTGPTDRYGDFDLDGMNNYAEFIAGMIPTNAASFHAITTAAVNGTSNYAIRFPVPAETQFRTPAYKIQYSADLASWSTVAAPVLNTSLPGVIEWIDNGTQTGGTAPLDLPGPRFYRVKVE